MMYRIIDKKKNGQELTDSEIQYFVENYTNGNIPDYQASALLMAICINGCSVRETVALTYAIEKSGEEVDLEKFGNLTCDKHSTGGVGDKTTLIVSPIVASLGCRVAKMSGRGLGHTGGTVDKLEAIKGYRIALTPEEFEKQVEKVGIAVVGQSRNLAPADKKIYALRDATATVDSIPLITSSIMGKKLASGSHSIVLDVKCGSGSFMKTPKDAEKLASLMVKIGYARERNVSALITDMDTPLGHCVGNILEVTEAIDVLNCKGDKDITEVSLALATEMVHLTLGMSITDAREKCENALKTGLAKAKFIEWIEAQGGDVNLIENPSLFDTPHYLKEIFAKQDGYICSMNTEMIGLASVELGAGRKKKDDAIDYSAGIVIEKKTGDRVQRGDVIAKLYANDEKLFENAEKLYTCAIVYGEKPRKEVPLIYKTLRKGDV